MAPAFRVFRVLRPFRIHRAAIRHLDADPAPAPARVRTPRPALFVVGWLKSIAQALNLSAEALFTQAGLITESTQPDDNATETALRTDPRACTSDESSRTLDMSRLSEFSGECCASSRLGRCRLLAPRHCESNSRRPVFSGCTSGRLNRLVGATFDRSRLTQATAWLPPNLTDPVGVEAGQPVVQPLGPRLPGLV